MANLLIGEYEHTLDEKKRVSLPKVFRFAMGKKIVVTRGFDHCLYAYSRDAWDVVAKKLQSLSMVNPDTRGFNRFMLSGAAEVDVDGVGRILIPDHQKEFAGLKKRVIFAGISDHVEIWNSEAWNTYKALIEKNADKMAAKLDSIGAL
ncbi:division/cell wall cluster transcriptional repressor MraZ [Candidatus Kaiserbacteria bacterium RIFCSPHIGHO2_02_FULL_55_20]|uniref:Transcriptional regulator MraZ n=1 Tax=Candidatus Kaiserbacteria bacterium RIFCSPHIGHO2_02_FULL_55_20 TaxID=1798497 RepID=A0A1F6DWB9_9BACT|nr:MAG: division/cell wall cluster transcriptional repressor MraZ [Candidatus Kaiserbacteria bacterium RIFCSPHIGHO2_01_FULL_55_37]OGG65322.1 MAG: division/cell wall cluster transcriptional repressor MraZ [Candidatus Kaiserbacteria bacterium RIFCSPHIGHO2_02_FULL_55_20]